MSRIVVLLLLSVSLWHPEIEAAKILALFPFPSASHSVVCHALTLELARRGHELLVITSDPVVDNVPPNYRQIDMSFTYQLKKHAKMPPVGVFDVWMLNKGLNDFGNILVEEVFSHPFVSELIAPNSTATFDLVVMEWAMWDGLNAIAHRFSAPVVGISTLNLNINWYYSAGNPLNPAYRPAPYVGYTDRMTFWERFVNLYYNAMMVYMHDKHVEIQNAIVEKYMGKDLPHVREMSKNVSLLLVYADPIMFYPQPNVPAVIEVFGMHINERKKEVVLPKNLQSFLDGAENGFIYFSLGSTIPSSKLPEASRKEILQAFAELPHRVLWKWENETLPDKPDNVYISKWLPQQQILAHPKIGLFVYQGGLQSTEEAVEYCIPMVGIPLFSDQESNVKKIEASGLGKAIKADIRSIKKEELKSAILEIIGNKTYKERMIEFRKLRNDRPQDVLEKAIWWTEYVIRHKGASHLRVQGVDMPWYQLHFVDIIATIIVTFLLACICIYILTKYLISKLVTSRNKITNKTKYE